MISGASIATRFSWASLRQTTRPEDLAYCLLGLLGINMPMLYGEGAQAFYRLQLELIKKTNEHTIFAWQMPRNELYVSVSTILAPTAAAFEFSAHVKPIASLRPAETMTFEMTNNGLRINLPCIPITQERMIAIIDCENNDGDRLGIWLERSKGTQFHRMPDSDLSVMKPRDIDDAELTELFLEAIPQNDIKESRSLYLLDFDWYHRWSHAPSHTFQLLSKPHGPYKYRMSMDEHDFACIIFRAHISPKNGPYFTIFVGLHSGLPTVRCVQGYFASRSDTELKELVEELRRDNFKYARDHYRAALCCNSHLVIELRRTYKAPHICWKLNVTIEGRVSDKEANSKPQVYSESCLNRLELDGSLREFHRRRTMHPLAIMPNASGGTESLASAEK